MQMGGRSVRNGPGELVGSTLPDIGTVVRKHLGGDFSAVEDISQEVTHIY